MKKITILLLSIIFVFTLGACANQKQPSPSSEELSSESQSEVSEESQPEVSEEVPEESMEGAQGSKVLIVYYSYSGVTEGVSKMLQEKTGGDVFELLPVEPYPDDMYETSDRAAGELESGNLPQLTGELPDLENYDVILVGGPVWSEKAASPVVSYLSQTDFGGKTVAPFWTYNSNEGAYKDNVISYIKNAKISDSLGLAHASSMEDTEMNQALDQWLDQILDKTSENTAMNETKITLTIGNEKIDAVLNDSSAAKEFQAMLPLTLSMTRMGEHEYYDALPQPLTHAEDLQTGYTVGDLAFWTPGDLFALYFDEPENEPKGLMILGQITSDLSVFDKLGNPEEVRIELTD